MNRSLRSRLAACACLALVAVLAYACKDSTAPTVKVPMTLVVTNPAFPGGDAAGVVVVTRARFVANRADGTPALDTLVTLTPTTGALRALRGAPSLAGLRADVAAGQMQFTFNVPLSHSAPSTGEDLTVAVDFFGADGAIAFRAGPVVVHASETSPPAPVTMPAEYTGTGFTARSVQITPPTATVILGGTADFTGTALDANGIAVPGAPIMWSSDNAAVATVPNATQGHAVAGQARGTAHIHAELVTGESADATLVVQPAATNISLQGGNNQTATVGTALIPFTVKVTASDAIGVSGVPVTFAVATGGGTLSATQVMTDADGFASTTFTLGATAGAATVTATAAGLAGSPVTFTATGVSAGASVLVYTSQPVSNLAELNLAPIVVEARDGLGNLASGYTGTVTLALDAPPANVALEGTTSVAAVGGVATFAAVRVSQSATGLRLRATGTSNVTSALSAAFNITAAVATKLVLTTAPVVGNLTTPIHFVIEARTADDGIAREFTGSLSASLLAQPNGGAITSVASAGFVNGVAGLDITVNVIGTYVFDISTPTLPEVFSPQVSVTNALIQIASGDGQTATASHQLAQALVARVVDGPGNPLSGVSVTWLVTSGGGVVTPLTATTDASGLASATWVIGAAGAQAVQARIGTTGPIVTFTATIVP